MNNRGLKVLATLVVLVLALGVGAAMGGGLVYALMQIGDVIPVAKAQTADPGYGIVIASVATDGPAAEAGVVRGDILLEINDEILERPHDLVRLFYDLEPGDEIELIVLHGDDQRTLTAILGERDGGPYLGLTPCAAFHEDVEVHLGSPGALIIEVVPDSPAEQAGLQEGDTIVAVDGQELNADNELAKVIADYGPGDTVALEVERPEEESREVDVELGEHPEREGAAYLGVRYLPASPIRLGVYGADKWERWPLEGLPLGEDFFFLPPEGEIQQGVIVQHVYEDSPASAAGLEEGHVITAVDGKSVESPQSLADVVAEREPGDEIVLTVFRPEEEEEREIEVTLGEHPDQEGKAYLGVRLGFFFHMERSEGDQLPDRFRFFERPFAFDFEFPFEELPFDTDEWPHRFEFEWRWPPGEDVIDWPAYLGESV